MESYFWWDYKVSNFFFYGLNIHSVAAFVVVCLVLMVFAFVFEWLKLLQINVRNSRLGVQLQLSVCSSESDSLLTDAHEAGPSSAPLTAAAVPGRMERFLQTFNDLALWLSQQLIAYFLMLSVMLYNGNFMVAVVLGAAIGYFVFGPKFIQLNLENFQRSQNLFCAKDCTVTDKTTLLGSRSNTSVAVERETSPIAQSSAIAILHH